MHGPGQVEKSFVGPDRIHSPLSHDLRSERREELRKPKKGKTGDHSDELRMIFQGIFIGWDDTKQSLACSLCQQRDTNCTLH